MADRPQNELPPSNQTPEAAETSASPEPVDPNLLLSQAIVDRLKNPDAFTAMFTDPTKRTGKIQFIVIDSPNGDRHIALQAGDPQQPGHGFPYVKATWWDEAVGSTGEAQYVNRPDTYSGHTTISIEPMDPTHVQYWRETGGIEWQVEAIINPATDDTLRELAANIQGGKINMAMTNGALAHLRSTLGAERVIDTEAERSSTPPQLPSAQ